MRKLLALTVLAITTLPSVACNLSIQSEFDYPQSLRYRVDSIMNYATETGSICLRRLPDRTIVEAFIMHPKEMKLMAIAELDRESILNGSQSIGPTQVAQYYVCKGSCSKETIEKLHNHTDFKIFAEHIGKKFNSLESTQEAITPEIVQNASKLKEYIEKN